MKQLTILSLSLLLFGSCVQPKQSPNYSTTEIYRPNSNDIYIPNDVPYAQPLAELQTAWSHLDEGSQWTSFTQRAIRDYGQELMRTIPTDIETYCPNYRTLDHRRRGDFWLALISKLAYFESSHNPQTYYREKFPDNNGNRVVSRGLLQISIESANGSHYRCGINNPQELHDPQKNLECGVKILNKWISTDRVMVRKEGRYWRGAARYWSPFRSVEKNEKMAQFTRSLPYCQ